jgi:hypothetical protein
LHGTVVYSVFEYNTWDSYTGWDDTIVARVEGLGTMSSLHEETMRMQRQAAIGRPDQGMDWVRNSEGEETQG